MRMISILGAALVFALSIAVVQARADEKEISIDKIPIAVVKAAKVKFPKIEIKSASEETQDGKTTYELNSVIEGTNYDITLKPDGTIVSIEKEIKESDLPAAVLATLKAMYAKAKFKKFEEITKGTEVMYEVELEGAGGVKEVVLDKNGKVVKEEK